MQLFLDTASLDEIKQGARLGVVKGVTTNPSLAAKVGIGGFKAYRAAVQEIAAIIDGPISVEVVSTDVEGMITEGKDIATWIDNPWVKLPSTATGFQAMAALAREGIKINQTLCFSTNQALLGAQAGATVVSPFVGRLDDIGQRGMDLVAEIAQIFATYRDRGVTTKVMAASVRSPFHCIEAAKAGADIATIPFTVLTQMAKHPLTDIGVARFLEDWRKASKA
ncbi:MAG: fructose-6-phosphate aldolase [SAR202 cluster bacterium]|nr:fructose-6-phosphate aldolase [SAR202 cluster bacterium]